MRIILFSGVLLALAFPGCREELGPFDGMNAKLGIITYDVVASDVQSIGEMNRIHVTVEPRRFRKLTIHPADLYKGLCEAVLAESENLGFPPEQIFRVSVRVVYPRLRTETAFLPISVRDGSCVPDEDEGSYSYRYPEPIDDYLLRAIPASDDVEGGIEILFVYDGDARPEFRHFDFMAACSYVAQDYEAVGEASIPFEDGRIVVVVAGEATRTGAGGVVKGAGQKFVISDGRCASIQTGAPT